jgi:hypothetical protein
MSSPYFVCVNDAAAGSLRAESVVICGDPDGPEHDAIYDEKATAIEKRDRLRQEYDNPYISVYQMKLEQVEAEEEPEGGR